MASLQELSELKEKQRLAALQKKLLPYDGHCWCCLMADCTHEPGSDECPQCETTTPDMSDFRESKPAQTRAAQKALRSRGRAQLPPMSEDEKRARRVRYKAAYHLRKTKLAHLAQERCLAHLALLKQPLVGSGPLGSFTFYEEIAIDFALRLDQYMSPAQLAREPGTVNRAAVQIFAKQVKAAGLSSLHAARTPAEDATTDFVALRQRLQSSQLADDVRSLMITVHDKERIKYGSLPEVAELDSDSSLLDIVAAVRKAAAPKRGRPPKLSVAVGSAGIEIAMNWVDGGYTVEAMVARAEFDTRRINVSQKEMQSDVLAGSALIFKGIPSLTELRQFKPRNRPLQISHASTARLHAMQLDAYHCEEAAKRVYAWFPQWDEGSKRGVTAVMAGANGLLKDIESESLTSDDDFYSDVLGFQILSSKTGKAVAEALIAIFEPRGVKECYFCGTDAVSSNVGYATGSIAYLRRHYKQPLIFALRCGGHIDMRSWKRGLEATGTEATRSPIKRKADEATIGAELLAIEDLYYIEKKWPALGEAMQVRLPNGETLLKTSGCPDSRWTFWEELLKHKVGYTLTNPHLSPSPSPSPSPTPSPSPSTLTLHPNPHPRPRLVRSTLGRG